LANLAVQGVTTMKQIHFTLDEAMFVIAQSLILVAEDLSELADTIATSNREEYLGEHLLKMKALRTVLVYNTNKLEALTGQTDPSVDDIPF